jgi:hypothetical protein
MDDADRLRLLHAPYRPPRCRVGGWLTCAVRGRLGGLPGGDTLARLIGRGREGGSCNGRTLGPRRGPAGGAFQAVD